MPAGRVFKFRFAIPDKPVYPDKAAFDEDVAAGAQFILVVSDGASVGVSFASEHRFHAHCRFDDDGKLCYVSAATHNLNYVSAAHLWDGSLGPRRVIHVELPATPLFTGTSTGCRRRLPADFLVQVERLMRFPSAVPWRAVVLMGGRADCVQLTHGTPLERPRGFITKLHEAVPRRISQLVTAWSSYCGHEVSVIYIGTGSRAMNKPATAEGLASSLSMRTAPLAKIPDLGTTFGSLGTSDMEGLLAFWMAWLRDICELVRSGKAETSFIPSPVAPIVNRCFDNHGFVAAHAVEAFVHYVYTAIALGLCIGVLDESGRSIPVAVYGCAGQFNYFLRNESFKKFGSLPYIKALCPSGQHRHQGLDCSAATEVFRTLAGGWKAYCSDPSLFAMVSVLKLH